MTTAELLRRRLELVFEWYRGMVNPETGMLEYLYLPEADRFVRENCFIRDIASVWDVEVLGAFLDRRELRSMATASLRHFGDLIVEHGGCTALDCVQLGEPSSIAHSAFMMLALLDAPEPPRTPEIAASSEGLNDAYSIARSLDDERAKRYRQCLCTGLKYLLALQCTSGGTMRERGGFGLSLSERAQRIDNTGHAASAFIKSIENGIDCA